MSKVALKIDDTVIDHKDNINYSLENDSTNIALSHHEKTGFGVSILDKETNIIRYYKIVDSVLVLERVEDVLTGEECKRYEPRTCENCIWYSYDSLMKDHYCGNRECSFNQVPVEKDDNCGKWKQK